MSDLVNPADIERLVGAPRHPTEHLLAVVPGGYGSWPTWYLMHPSACVASTPDLRECEHSMAADETDVRGWPTGVPLAVEVHADDLGQWLEIARTLEARREPWPRA